MPRPTDVRPVGAALRYLPVRARLPLKFGPETLTEVVCARVALEVEDRAGRRAIGWGETPLSVQWTWPSALSYAERLDAKRALCAALTEAWAGFDRFGHPVEVGHAFQREVLHALAEEVDRKRRADVGAAADADGRFEPIPHLAALVCCSPFDIALHDAFARLAGAPIYDLYGPEFLNTDLADFLEAAPDSDVSFRGRTPADFLDPRPPLELPAWHLVGGKDLLDPSERDGSEPDDGHPVLLRDWIRRDGLKCLKIKLRGDDPEWDRARIEAVGRIAVEEGVDWLTADFNCTVREPAYVNAILDALMRESPRVHGMLLYIEQPFPYDLETWRIDVRSVSARKPLFMDESAHDWRLIRLGRSLGWSGVALKTCKTQTEALLSLCWAKAHGMTLMVQDLSNPMLAQIPHVQLAARAGTIMGVETNGMQFYPEASRPEATVHPGLYQRRDGKVRLDTLAGPGFGYREAEIPRELPDPAVVAGSLRS